MRLPLFASREVFERAEGYRLLPFRFERLDDERYVVTNDVGEYVVLDRATLFDFVNGRLPRSSSSFRALESRHLLYTDENSVAFDLLALKLRNRHDQIAAFTGLHIFVVTLRCDHSCQYCQVSRQSEDRMQYDMTMDDALRAVRLAFHSPNPNLKIEFQGGEPLLNFPLIRSVVEEANRLNVSEARNIQFVIASNLSHLSPEILAFCAENGVLFSTSLDGPRDLHDSNRPMRGGSSYEAAVAGVERVRETLGRGHVSAVMTTTPASLARVEEIVDEYAQLGFTSIFLRNLSPYGFAARSLVHRYSVDSWLEFFRRGLARVLELNESGTPMREEFTTILLQKMFGPLGSTYVDLQSPAGLGIGALVYNYDGSIYASDEGRMLAEMGDQSFRVGHVRTSAWEDVFTSPVLLDVLSETLPESAPMCADCGFLPFCGADPVFHAATQGDVLGHKALSAFCAKQKGVIRHLIDLLETNAAARETMMGWI